MKTRITKSLAAGLLASTATGMSAAAYHVTVLHSPGSDSQAYGINNEGDVVGSAMGGAFSWDGTTMTILGTGGTATAFAINDNGQVVGYKFHDGRPYATLWQGGTESDLTDLTPGYSTAFAINNAGLIAGQSNWGTNFGIATMWRAGSPSNLFPDGTDSRASGMNNAGQIVGYSFGPHNDFSLPPHATLWSNGSRTDISTLPSKANAINDAGLIAGESFYGGVVHATTWYGSVTTALGTLSGNSSATGVNNRGQVVGWSIAGDGTQHAALWNGTTAIDLNSFLDASLAAEGWYLHSATAINDKGSITGDAVNRVTGESQAYLMSVADAPEPSAVALMATGMAILACTRGARRRGGRPSMKKAFVRRTHEGQA